ncbi:MAG: DUF5668 domain-containing protein [Acidobacteriaceae bacterium]
MNTTANQNEAVVAYCRTCGKPLSEAAKREVYGVIYCEDCLAARVHGGPAAAGAGAPQPAAPMAYLPTAPNPALAFILGWIPGVGAMYNGQVAKGFVHVGIFAGIITILNSTDNGAVQAFFGIGLAGFVVYMAFEALQTAKALRFGQPVPDYLRILHTLDNMGMRSEAGAARSYVPPMPVQPNASAATTPEQTQSYPQPEQRQAYQAYAAPVQTVQAVQAVEVEPAPERVPVTAIVLIGLGVLFLLSTLNVFDFSGRFIWPVLLIALGVWLAARRLAGGR